MDLPFSLVFLVGLIACSSVKEPEGVRERSNIRVQEFRNKQSGRKSRSLRSSTIPIFRTLLRISTENLDCSCSRVPKYKVYIQVAPSMVHENRGLRRPFLPLYAYILLDPLSKLCIRAFGKIERKNLRCGTDLIVFLSLVRVMRVTTLAITHPINFSSESPYRQTRTSLMLCIHATQALLFTSPHIISAPPLPPVPTGF